MWFYAHIAFAFLVSGFFVTKWSPVLFLLVLLGAILPDLDYPYSFIGGLFPSVSKLLFKHFGHRGLLHSIYIPVTMIFDYFFWHNHYYLVFCIAYTSHIIIDMLTKSGVRLLYPSDYSFTILDGELESGSTKSNVLITVFSVIGFIIWRLYGNWIISLIW